MRVSKAQFDMHAYAAVIYLIRFLIQPVSLQDAQMREDYGESAARMRRSDARSASATGLGFSFFHMHEYTLII